MRPLTSETKAPFDLEEAMVAAIAGGEIKVPPYPAVALRLDEMLRRTECGLKEVVSVVSSDPSLAADVLRCANSAFYGRGAQVSALLPAITRLGANEVLRMAIVSGLAVSSRQSGPLAELRRDTWHDAVAAALLAQTIAKMRAQPADTAFICGLLHDFGWLLGTRAAEEILDAHPEVAARSAEAWRTIIGRHHRELGLSVAARWRLPPQVVECIARHHDTDLSESEHAPLVEIVQAADQVVALLTQRPHLTADDLSAAYSVRPSERVRVAAALPQIPQVLASFEAPQQMERSTVSKVLPLEAPSAAFLEYRAPLKLHSPRRSVPTELAAVGPAALALTSTHPLPPNVLLDLEIGIKPAPLRFWAKSARCDGVEGAFVIECKPMLLDTQQLQRWTTMVRDANTNARAANTDSA